MIIISAVNVFSFSMLRQEELKVILDALDYFKFDKGLIITADQTDRFEQAGRQIEMVPAYRFLAS